MVQNNKVLTVSYGTFSCTLEGFDDSFETMKAIAEYFRDLAADDRYFGSEPPQPDTDMLTRIAQRDASKRVEASQSDTGLLLRATEEVAEPSAPARQAAANQPDLSVINTPTATRAPVDGPRSDPAKAEPVASARPPAADSIAAKLQRIRAVVSHSDDMPASYMEDEEAAFMNSGPAPVDAVSAAFEAGALTPNDFDSETDAKEDTTSAEAPEPVSEEMPKPVPTALLQDEEDAAEADALFSNLDEAQEEEGEHDDIVNILSDEDADEDSDAAEEHIVDTPDTEEEQGTLTAEDEVNLLNEISDIEAELAQNTNGPALSGESDLDQDVSRLMAKAGAHMDDPATSNQRETYSHLRTAVAATEAELQGEGETDRASIDQDYRGDLASVVSPRRPEIQVTSMRPESDSSAPLKLVAEQRVDTPEAETGPVTPRRVTTPQEDAATEEGGFVLFAQEQGAQSLPDLLEAAAAYLSFIEGQEQFSRPQLMNKVRSLKQDDFNREESLRSFGQLLRDGKIERAGGGRFAASNQIGFRPDDKRAAG